LSPDDDKSLRAVGSEYVSFVTSRPTLLTRFYWSQCVAERCRVLQCVAVCCSVMQCIAVCFLCHLAAISFHALLLVSVCCSVLQCAAVCCSVTHSSHTLLPISVCCSVLQCVAVCYSVLQCVAVFSLS